MRIINIYRERIKKNYPKEKRDTHIDFSYLDEISGIHGIMKN